jgi:DNA-binding response OmpR family regulator
MPPDRTPTVLVVDDEEILLRLMTRILERVGCTVACARDGAEARRLFDADPERFEVAILDVSVPPEGGLSVLRALRARRPGLAAILTSGTGPDAEVRDFLRGGGGIFVGKPFAPAELSRALAEVRLRKGSGISS